MNTLLLQILRWPAATAAAVLLLFLGLTVEGFEHKVKPGGESIQVRSYTTGYSILLCGRLYIAVDTLPLVHV